MSKLMLMKLCRQNGLESAGKDKDALIALLLGGGGGGSDRHDVKINKGGAKLGMSLCGPKDTGDPRVGIFVTKVKDDSPATGLLQAQTRIYAVNGNDCTTATKAECTPTPLAAMPLVTMPLYAKPLRRYSQTISPFFFLFLWHR